VEKCTCFITCQQPISIMTELLNLWQDGANASTLMGNVMKKMIAQWDWKLWWLFIGSQEHWSLIYCTLLVGFKKQLQWFKNSEKIENNTKFPFFKFTFFCVTGCGYNRGWIGQVFRSLIIHSLSHLFLFSDGRLPTISLRGANTVSPFSGTQTMW